VSGNLRSEWLRWLMTRRWSAGAQSASTLSGSGPRSRSIRSCSMRSMPETTSAALRESNKAEALARVLYPADQTPAGQELRLRQEYFFSSASLQDILRRHLQEYGDLRSLPDKVAIQLNDTHPAISVAELMRLLIDIHRFGFRCRMGDHQEGHSATPTTPCCPRHWKAGRCRCSSGCCRGTCSWSTPSTPRCSATPGQGARLR
jgi:hypothetical protein